MTTRVLVSDDGITKTYRVTNGGGQVIGYDQEPSNPAVTADPVVSLEKQVDGLAQAVEAKTTVTPADVTAAIGDATDVLPDLPLP